MGRYFIDGNHVTSHNALLKYLVEGGAVGLTLVSAYLFLVVRGIWRSGAIRTPINPVGAALIGLMVMGLTGAIFEANPVAGLLGVAIGAESGKRSYSA
jgi:O-antigen ligase